MPDLFTWEDVQRLTHHTITRKHMLRMIREGRAPKPFRLTPHAPPLWPIPVVQSWLADRGIILVEEFDGEPQVFGR